MKKRTTIKLFLPLSIFAILYLTQICCAAVRYVSPTGSATWANCSKIDTPCSLATANANAVAGDVVILRGGIYTTHIFPANSGSSGNPITYQAYSGETPTIKNTTTPYVTYYHGIALIRRSYIKVVGITVQETQYSLMIMFGASYNEISHCVFDGGAIQIWDGVAASPDTGTPCVHNWIHHSTIKNTGGVSADCNDLGGMQLGVPAYDKWSNYTTIENNTFYCGGHHNLETFTKYNVIRNNYFHHEGCMTAPDKTCPYGPDTNGKYGNRNIQIYDGYNEDGKFNLVESNRFGHSGPSPDDDGGDGFTLTAPKNIVRYNSIFNSQNNGILMKTGYNSYSNNNRIYNNTIYKSGRYRNLGGQWQGANFRWYGHYARIGNVVKNNILNTSGNTDWIGGDAHIYVNNIVTNNYCTELPYVFKILSLTGDGGRCSVNGNPKFVNTDVSDPTSLVLPNFNLQSDSPAIDVGTHLTTAVRSGSNSNSLVVHDALYFQDGTWGSALSNRQADWIAIGTVGNVVQISSINYATNTITLASSMTWAANAPVWLYKKSDGVRVLYGSAPDMGAHEYKE